MFHDTVIAHLRKTFSLSKENSKSFNFLGLEIEQECGAVIIHQHNYISNIPPINLTNSTSTIPLTKYEARHLKALVGQIQWAAKQTRPDAAYIACDLSTRIKHGTVADARRAYKQLKHLQQTEVKIVISNTGDVKVSSLILFSDASHGNLINGGSQGGFVLLLHGESKIAPLIWRSHKLKRVVKSAMGAETMALLEGAEHAMLIRALIKEIFSVDIPIICISDNKSLVEAVKNTNVIEDKRLYIDICALREMVEKGEIGELILTKSSDQIADCLTKGTASAENLLRILSGREQLKYR